MTAPKDNELPFRVVETEQHENLHSGYSDLEGAEKNAERLNKAATEMGLKTRYKAIPKP